MTKLRACVLILLIAVSKMFSQTAATFFEGEINYSNTYKSKDPKLKEKQLSAMLGSIHNYYFKAGDYKVMTNGLFAQWQLYINKDNKLYNKMASSDTAFWNDAAVHDDEVLSSKINKNVITILGYPCDELILNCISGVHKYYYNAKLGVDAKLFVNHKFGNYYNFVSRAKAVALKMIIEDRDFIIESVATKVTPRKIPATFLQLPPGIKTAKSVY